MALVQAAAGEGFGAKAHATLAGVKLSAEVGVQARCTIQLEESKASSVFIVRANGDSSRLCSGSYHSDLAGGPPA